MLKQRVREFTYIINQNGIFCSLIVDELSSIPTHTHRDTDIAVNAAPGRVESEDLVWACD